VDTVEIVPIGSRTTVLDLTELGLTSEFGMGSGVTLATVTVSERSINQLLLNFSLLLRSQRL